MNRPPMNAPVPSRPRRPRGTSLVERSVTVGAETVRVLADADESPLAWLARRTGRDGRPHITPLQFAAGERLRADFTRAGMAPGLGVDWSRPAGGSRRPGALDPTETMIAARQRVVRALDAAGNDLAGLLLDVCCFLKRLEAVEAERRWPARAGKVVLRIALDRLADHYGLTQTARGPARSHTRTWLAEGETFRVEC